MIIEYHRPETIEEALRLLARAQPVSLPLGGGSTLAGPSPQQIAAVDLQDLGLDSIQPRGNFLELGATARLQALLESADVPQELKAVVEYEANRNLRQVATVAGTLVSAGGRSPFTTAMLALDATLSLLPAGEPEIDLGDLLPVRSERLRGRLITSITLSLNARLGYDYVARTPADQPLVCVAVAVWPSGRTRVALGGYGEAPRLAFDGSEASGADIAARSAYAQAGDEWASAVYRQEVAAILTKRLLAIWD